MVISGAFPTQTHTKLHRFHWTTLYKIRSITSAKVPWKDVRTKSGADIPSDHHIVVIKDWTTEEAG